MLNIFNEKTSHKPKPNKLSRRIIEIVKVLFSSLIITNTYKNHQRQPNLYNSFTNFTYVCCSNYWKNK